MIELNVNMICPITAGFSAKVNKSRSPRAGYRLNFSDFDTDSDSNSAFQIRF